MKKQRIVIVALSIVIASISPVNPLTRFFVAIASAEDVTVSGNGEGSSNSVEVTNQNNTSVSQNNTSQVDNTVNASAQTGNNSASNNTGGDASIVTGDISSQVAVENTANTSQIDTSNCCSQGGSIAISGNGANTTNTAHATATTTIVTNVDQKATIINNIKGTAVTGNNSASNNTGNVQIVTGDISVRELIKNGPVNTTSVKSGAGSQDYDVFIKNNGFGSENAAIIAENVLIENKIRNEAFITNNSFWDLISGNNKANKNNGDVFIKTGDIKQDVTIENNSNTSTVETSCCEVKHQETPIPTPPSPTPQKDEGKPGSGGSGSGTGGPGGSSGVGTGAAVGNVLPVTGVNWMLFALLANVVMLFMGMVLRLRSGRSPGFSSNFVL